MPTIAPGHDVRAVRLRRHPGGLPLPDDFETSAERWESPEDGEIALRVTHLSIDPFERLRMTRGGPGPEIGVGEVVSGRAVGEVVETRTPLFREGDLAAGPFGWREGATVFAAMATPLGEDTSAERYLSLLGPSGLAAYFASVEVAKVSAADTVVVAPAAGSVGSLAGQIAGIAGSRVIGIARGAAQCAAVRRLPGFAGAIDAEGEVGGELRTLCPDGVSVFLDGLGGAVHDAVVANLAAHARVVLLGFVAEYGRPLPARYGNAAPVLFKRAQMSGFLLADWTDRFPRARAQLAAWADEDALRPLRTVWHGLECAPQAFCELFGAAAPGKHIVQLERGEG